MMRNHLQLNFYELFIENFVISHPLFLLFFSLCDDYEYVCEKVSDQYIHSVFYLFNLFNDSLLESSFKNSSQYFNLSAFYQSILKLLSSIFLEINTRYI